MAVVQGATERRLLLVKAERERWLMGVTRLNARVRVLTEKLRAERRSEERKKLKSEMEVKKRKAVKGKVMKRKQGKAKAKSKVRTKVGNGPRGRPALYAGECVACVYRATGRAGGPKHWGPDCRVLRDATAVR